MQIIKQDLERESYRLIRIKARDSVDPVNNEILGAYVRGVVDLQTELYSLLTKKEDING